MVLGIKTKKHREGFTPRLVCFGLQNGLCLKVDFEMSVLSCADDADYDIGKILLSYHFCLQTMLSPCLKWAGGKDTEFGWGKTQGSCLPALGV